MDVEQLTKDATDGTLSVEQLVQIIVLLQQQNFELRSGLKNWKNNSISSSGRNRRLIAIRCRNKSDSKNAGKK
jgi:hypothetical protein